MSAVQDYQISLSARTSIPAPDMVGTLVGQALDDLDASRIDVEAALRLVAAIAWQHGRDQTRRH